MVQNIESPRTLTGGQAVHDTTRQKAVVDWLQVTLKGKKTWSEILMIFGLEKVEFNHFEKGFYGYPNMYGMGNIMIMFKDDLQEYHVQMSGQGCRMFEKVSRINWKELFSTLHEDEASSFTRLDLAIDDFGQSFTIPTIKRKMKRGELVTKFRQGDDQTKYNFRSEELGNSPKAGDGVRFGSPTSRLLIRMYDKKLERDGEGFDVLVDSWLRVELQLRKEYANEAVGELLQSEFSVGLIAKRYLKEYIRFVDKGTDSNKRRWKVSNFWEKYLGAIEPLKLSLQAPDKTIAKTIQWLDHAISPSLAMVYEANGETFFKRFIKQMQTDGKKRMKKKHEVMVNDHLENGKISREKNKLKMAEIKEKMTSIRKNRSQKQTEKYNRMVLKKYSMNTGVSPEFDNSSVLDKPTPRIRLLNEEE